MDICNAMWITKLWSVPVRYPHWILQIFVSSSRKRMIISSLASLRYPHSFADMTICTISLIGCNLNLDPGSKPCLVPENPLDKGKECGSLKLSTLFFADNRNCLQKAGIRNYPLIFRCRVSTASFHSGSFWIILRQREQLEEMVVWSRPPIWAPISA